MRNLKNLIPYILRYKAFLITGLLVLLLLASVTLVQPYLIRLGIDSLQANKFEPLISLVIVLVGLVQFGLGFMQRWSVNRVGHVVEADIRKTLFEKLQTLDRRFFDQNSVGDLIVHSTSDISIQRNFIVQGIVSGANTVFMGVIALGLMFYQNWKLALIGLVFLPFMAVAFSWIRRRMETVYQAAQERLGEVSNRIQEVLYGIRVVKAYTVEQAEADRYAHENLLYVGDRLRFARLNSFLIPLIQLATGLTTALLLWVGANEIEHGNLTIGQFVQFNAYLLLLAGPLSNLGAVMGIGQQAAISMGRLQRILLYEPEIAEPDPQDVVVPPSAKKGETTLEFKDAGMRFGEKWALRHLNFKIQTGQTVAVVGPTGSGKTSLASLIGRVYDPDEGAVLLNGANVKDIPLEELRRRVTYVPQETLLFSLSLRDNIAFGKHHAIEDEINTAADLSRLAQDLPQIPGGFDAKVGERGVTLSGGQKQRTAIARALVPDSELLILDDALSSVDASTQNLIAANLRLLASQGRTTLIVTQRLALVKDADWIVVLDGGRIVAEGTHATLLGQDGSLYVRMYQHELAAAADSMLDEAVFPTNRAGGGAADGGGTTAPALKAKAAEPVEKLAGTAAMTAEPEKPRRNILGGKSKKVKTEDVGDEILGLDYHGGRLTRLSRYIVRYWRILLLAAPIIIVGSLLELVGPLLSKSAIDNYITPKRLDGLGLVLWLFAGATILSFVMRYFRAYLMEKIGQLVVRDLRVDLFTHLLGHSLSFFDRYPAGSLIGRLTSDMDAINDLLSQGAVAVVADLITVVAIVTTMFILDWRLALVSLAVLPILFVSTNIFRKILRQAWRSSRRKYSVLVGNMAENYSGMLTIQLFNRQQRNLETFDELNQDYFQSNRYIVSINGIFLPLVSFLAQLANALLLLVAGWLYVQSGQITFGLIVAFLQYTERAFTPIRDLAERYTSFQAASASCERIFGLLDQKAAIQDPANPVALVEPGQKDWAEVTFDRVIFGYDPDFPVIKGISFKVAPGEKVAIVGATGAGKTSITSLLGRNYEIQSGSIRVNDVDVREVRQADLRQHMALVLQDPVLFKGTIAENVRLGRTDLSDEALREAAEYVGADTFIRQLPGGYDYELQERGTNLSAGQRQLLSFARALAYNPEGILILDEATSSVDSQSEAIIQDALKKLLAGRTALIIAHRLSTIRDVDRIIVMEKGRIAEMGTQAELLRMGKLYYNLYLNQMALVNNS